MTGRLRELDLDEARVADRIISARVDGCVAKWVAALEGLTDRVMDELGDMEPNKLRNLILSVKHANEMIRELKETAEEIRPVEQADLVHPDFDAFDEPAAPDGTATG